MKATRTTVFMICPNTNARMTQRQRWVLKAHDDYLKKSDEKRLLLKGKKGNNLARKRQMVRYMEFKDHIRVMAAEKQFTMPTGYFAIWFYVPYPASWRKNKIKENLYRPHLSAPDLDNYQKALYDALMPRKNKRQGEKGADDRRIHCAAAFKVWVEPDEACIKIIEYDQNEFMEEFKEGHPLALKGDCIAICES